MPRFIFFHFLESAPTYVKRKVIVFYYPHVRADGVLYIKRDKLMNDFLIVT